MPQTVINGVAGNADVLIDTQSYDTTLNRFRVRMDTRQLDATVFASEPNYDTEPGDTQARFDLSGIGKFGDAASGPFMPPPQDVALTFQYYTGCTIDFQGNFESAEGERIANQNMLITGSGVSKGPITVTWDRGVAP